MPDTEFIEVMLTCPSWQEAQAIADDLLDQHLVACVEFMETKSRYRWKQKIEGANEIKLIMQSLGANFARIKETVKKHHSYETPALHALPIAQITDEAAAWLRQETN